MVNKPKAVYIGPPKIGAAIMKRVTEWSFVYADSTIQGFTDKLDNDEIDNDIQCILIHDSLYVPTADNSPQPFNVFAAQYSPYCFFGILEYHENYTPRIKEGVSSILSNMTGEDETDLYFISKENFKPRLISKVESYISKHDNEVAAILAGREPQNIVDEEIETRKREIEDNNQRIEEAKSKYQSEERDGKIIACTSSKGGSGKSTITLLLATYLAHSSIQSVKDGAEKEPLKVCVLDLDTKDGQIGFITGAVKPTITHLQRHGITKETVEQTAIFNDRLKVDLFLAPQRLQTALEIEAGFYQELIAFLRTQYDYVILDTSVNYYDPLLGQVAYPMADFIIFVTDIVINSIFSMSRWITNVTMPIERKGLGIPKRKIGIIINKASTGVNMPPERISSFANGVRIITAIPSQAKLMANAANTQSMDQALRDPTIRKRIRKIAQGVAGRNYQLAENFAIGR